MAEQNEQRFQTRKFSMHGSAAYDVNATRVFPAVRVELPPDVVPEQRKPAAKPEAKRKTDPFAMLVLAMAVFVLILAAFTALRLTETERKNAELQAALSEAKAEHERLEREFRESVNLEAIRARAEAMGMREPTQDQIRYLNLGREDYAVITPAQRFPLLHRIADAITAGVETVLEYLS